MVTHPLLPDPASLTLDQLRIDGGIIRFEAHTLAESADCPRCGLAAQRLHSRYRRTLQDLPWQGNGVKIQVTVGKFFCDNRTCPQRIFAQRLPCLTHCYARKTNRLIDALQQLAYLAGGEAAARIARSFGLLVSADTLLDMLRRVHAFGTATPRVLGIDDFAFLRGHHYGTILIDLEKHCPVDLLADREAETVARWLTEHPGVEIISRDRSNAYREGATMGAPKAAQVADRWHLLKNLGEALERQVAQQHRHLRQVAQQMAAVTAAAQPAAAKPPMLSPVAVSPAVTMRVEQVSAVRREQRLAAYTKVWELHRQGLSQNVIAQQAGVSLRTVQRFLRSESFPERSKRSRQSRRTDAFVTYLQKRWDQGCHNVSQLFREVKAQGYHGCYGNVYSVIRSLSPSAPSRQRQPRSHKARSPARAQPPVPLPSRRSVSWWLRGYYCTSKPEVEACQHAFVDHLCHEAPVLKEAAELARQFHQIVTEREATALDAWLQMAKQSTSRELKLFAQGLCQDKAAVENAVKLCWSNGPVEGQVNRLKMLKRSMYGRAGFALLRARVLPLAS